MKKNFFLLTLVLSLLFLIPLKADEIHLKNGNKFSGKIIKETDTFVVLQMRGLGKMTFLKNKIEKIIRSSGSAENKKKDPLARPENLQKPGERHLLLWKVEGADSVYLYGTIHRGVDARKELPPKVWEIFKECKTCITEADVKALSPSRMLALGQLPKGKSLYSMLTSEAWARIQKDLGKSIPLTVLKKLRPWVVMTIYTMQFLPATPSVDSVFEEEAKAKGYKVEYLESALSQIEKMNSLPDQKVADLLCELLNNLATAHKDVDRMLEAYKAGDTAALGKSTEKDKKKIPGMYESLLLNRNKNWIPKIEAAIKQGKCFIAVGVAHLLGKDSVIRMLEDKGHKITPVYGKGPAIKEAPKGEPVIYARTLHYTVMLPLHFRPQKILPKADGTTIQCGDYKQGVFFVIMEDDKKLLKGRTITLKQYSQYNLSYAKKNLKDVKILRARENRIGGMKALEFDLVGTLKDNSGKLYYKMAYAESERYFFKITAWCLAAHTQKHLKTFEKILQSFKLVL